MICPVVLTINNDVRHVLAVCRTSRSSSGKQHVRTKDYPCGHEKKLETNRAGLWLINADG